MAVRGTADDTSPWIKMYHLGFLLGLVTGFVAHGAISTIFPPPHRLEGTTSHVDDDVYEQGDVPRNGSTEETDEKATEFVSVHPVV